MLDQNSNKGKNIENTSIYDYLNLNQYIKCKECDYLCSYKKKINSCPKILMITINLKERQNIKFNLDEEIDICDYLPVKKRYIQANSKKYL